MGKEPSLKEEFLKELYKIAQDFENKTGTELVPYISNE